MARYLSDQNKVLGVYESGTYGNTLTGSSFWMGQVTECSIEDAENLIETRYLGTTTRNFDVMDQGPRDVNIELTYHPQDMRLVFWTIGSPYSISGTTTGIHTATELDTNVVQSAFTSGLLNPPLSFTLEDSKQAPGTGQNFTRLVNGVVPVSLTYTASQGEKDVISLSAVGQTLTYKSGATTSVTEQTNRSYLWSDHSFTLAGSDLQTVKSVELEINQNREGMHYLNSSRDIAVPINGNRDYTLSVTLDWENDMAKVIYDNFYKGGSSFNITWDINADSNASSIGSQHASIYMSGCYITSMEIPSTNEGVTESTIEIRPETINAQEYNFNMGSGLINPY